ncbi:MAG: acylphosphatase [Candidatus Thermoplasmatota archaeon]
MRRGVFIPDKKKSIRVKITGRVQGVWFRSNTKQKADELGLVGWVKNMDDGSVEAVFQGEEDKINDIVKWCYKGPPLARVDKVYIKNEGLTESYKSFEILY